MSGGALILTYHAIEAGPPPLYIEPDRFRAHLDCIVESDAASLTVGELAAALGRGRLPEPAVAITFDDGAASVARTAAPLLAERGLRATAFCVAGHLGGSNDWPTEPPRSPRRELAGASELAELVAAGFEIGSHGMEHAPLATSDADLLRRELIESKHVLEDAAGVAVRAFAYPHGVAPSAPARRLLESAYDAACATGNARVGLGADPLALPRVDAHYLRRTALLRRALAGANWYLRSRRLGARARRLVRADHVEPQ